MLFYVLVLNGLWYRKVSQILSCYSTHWSKRSLVYILVTCNKKTELDRGRKAWCYNIYYDTPGRPHISFCYRLPGTSNYTPPNYKYGPDGFPIEKWAQECRYGKSGLYQNQHLKHTHYFLCSFWFLRSYFLLVKKIQNVEHTCEKHCLNPKILKPSFIYYIHTFFLKLVPKKRKALGEFGTVKRFFLYNLLKH